MSVASCYLVAPLTARVRVSRVYFAELGQLKEVFSQVADSQALRYVLRVLLAGQFLKLNPKTPEETMPGAAFAHWCAGLCAMQGTSEAVPVRSWLPVPDLIPLSLDFLV